MLTHVRDTGAIRHIPHVTTRVSSEPAEVVIRAGRTRSKSPEASLPKIRRVVVNDNVRGRLFASAAGLVNAECSKCNCLIKADQYVLEEELAGGAPFVCEACRSKDDPPVDVVTVEVNENKGDIEKRIEKNMAAKRTLVISQQEQNKTLTHKHNIERDLVTLNDKI